MELRRKGSLFTPKDECKLFCDVLNECASLILGYVGDISTRRQGQNLGHIAQYIHLMSLHPISNVFLYRWTLFTHPMRMFQNEKINKLRECFRMQINCVISI